VFARGGKRTVVGLLLASGLTPVACGSNSSASGDATAAARTFVEAVSRGDTRSWCPQIDAALLGESRQGRLATPVLNQCEQHDLFLITGSCDREAVVAGASITAVRSGGGRAEVELSTGATLRMRLVQHRWLIADVAGGHPVHLPRAGPCSPAVTGRV
jgi:hypothetical protein